jgi:hypothetical protein
MSRTIPLSAIAFILAATACTGGDTQGTDAQRDSAGITIIERKVPEGRVAFLLGADPIVDIGDEGRGDGHQLFDPSGAVTLSDGVIVVANQGTHDIRYFSPTGEHIRTVGQHGQGPGDFVSLSMLAAAPGDTLIVGDAGNGWRFSVLSPDGELVRTSLPVSTIRVGGALGLLEDGTVLMRSRQASGGARLPSGLPETGIASDTLRFGRLSLETGVMDTMLVAPAGDRIQGVVDGMVLNNTVPFGGTLTTAAQGNELLAGYGDTFEIRSYAPSGAVSRIIRVDRPGALVTREEQQAFREQLGHAARTDEGRRTVDQILSMVKFPERKPAYSFFRVDRADRIWVRDYRERADTTDWSWLVLAPDGEVLGTVVTPRDLTIYEIGEDYLLARRLGEDEVHHVVKLPLSVP